jgi:hypothetical protein
MIQRIQTIYLLMALVALASMVVFPLATISDKFDHVFVFSYNHLHASDAGLIDTYLVLPTAIFFSLLIGFITIFLYKNRKRQMTWCFLHMAVNLVIGIIIFIKYYQFRHLYVGGSDSLSFTSLCPIIAVILDYLAYRGIKKDDELVKSIDRIR